VQQSARKQREAKTAREVGEGDDALEARRARDSLTRADKGTEKVAVLVNVASIPPSCVHTCMPR
jgi:hypothetical protein